MKNTVKTAVDQITSTIPVADFESLCRRTLFYRCQLLNLGSTINHPFLRRSSASLLIVQVFPIRRGADMCIFTPCVSFCAKRSRSDSRLCIVFTHVMSNQDLNKYNS